MAGYGPLQRLTITMQAGLDLSGWQNRLVRISGVYIVKASTRSNCVGVLMNKPSAQGLQAEVCIFGLCEVKADGSVAAQDWLMSNASGYVTTATLGTGTGINIIGWTPEADGGAGSLVKAFICRTQGQL